MRKIRLRGTALLATILLLVGGLGLAEQVKLSNDIAWVKAADAYRCCFRQAYANAENRLQELARGQKAGTWCVVLDADETVISNVQFQIELQASGQGYSSSAWDEWCNRAAATALPGAKEFCSLVQKLGGKVIIVTNRKGNVKSPTARNLESAGIPYDLLLVREGAYALDRSKAMRRGDIEEGKIKTLPPGEKFPPLKILMLVGDQTHDLYDDKNLGCADVGERFGRDLVILPNPMYGDWSLPGVFVEGAAAPSGKTSSGALTWQEAMKKIGEEVVVEAMVVKVYDPETQGKTGPVKLNTDYDYRNSLTFVFYKKSRSGQDYGYPPPDSFRNKTVRVRGKVGEYKGSPQIMLRSTSDIEIIN